ncbi:MAG TPA: tRNA (guanine(46)-N(7))-methyltransferase TrmB [Rhabdochlamydiaceae bacterium]|nr:tRNA (guanine(46)-N(7))-methyltransferase TrmB [Rhabdochlamydiaceae bacterium]
MKPKNLKRPFTWDNRRPLICDRIVYVPEYYQNHSEFHFPKWGDPSLFGKQGKVFVEYCAGNGAWIVEKAIQQPEHLWVAVEKRFDRIRKIWSKIQNYKLDNLIAVYGEAQVFTRYYLASDSIDTCYVNFPDPWPKERHAKHRLIQTPFLQELSRVLRPNGTVTLVTDNPEYSGQMIDSMLKTSPWSSSFPAPYFVTEWENYGTSYFDDLWRAKGCMIRYLQFINGK